MLDADHAEQEALSLDAVDKFLARDVAPYAQKLEHDDTYPEEIVEAMKALGLFGAVIPEEYGGSGLLLTAASVIMEEINRTGGNSGACHGQMYIMNTLVRHGSEE